MQAGSWRRLDGVGRRFKAEFSHAECRHHPSGLEVAEHQQGALVPAEVFEGTCDPSPFDEERAIAGQSRLQDGLRIEGADVIETRHEDATLAFGDQLGGGLGSPRSTRHFAGSKRPVGPQD